MADQPEPEAAAQAADGVEAQLREAETKRDEYLGLARMLQAELENYRKRVERDRAQWSRESLASFLREFLGPFDDFRRALAEGEKSPDHGSLLQGVRMVHEGLWKAMEKSGVKAVEAQGRRFDPLVHEAIALAPAPGAEPNTVVEVFQNGYILGDVLLRPARVVVAGAGLPAEDGAPTPAQEGA